MIGEVAIPLQVSFPNVEPVPPFQFGNVISVRVADSRPTVGQQSADRWPTVDQQSTDRFFGELTSSLAGLYLFF